MSTSGTGAERQSIGRLRDAVEWFFGGLKETEVSFRYSNMLYEAIEELEQLRPIQSRLDSALLLTEKWREEAIGWYAECGPCPEGTVLNRVARDLRAILSGPESSPAAKEEA